MKNLLSNLKISVPQTLFIKDPETSKLGKRIVEHGILLINKVGFESFTFNKLGKMINSNESSIYRYFENKHKLLLYLSSWYWAWLERQLIIETFNISNNKEKLEKAITVVTREVKEDHNFSHINEIILYKVIVNESSKPFLTKEKDKNKKEQYFDVYKKIIARISDMILQINKEYPYSLTLASSIVEGGLHQHYLREHFPLITNCKHKDTPTHFFIHLVDKVLK